jgi:ATP-dependent Clp protease ATP-binding subunit ClpB
MLKEKNISLSATEEAIESLSRKGFNPQFGARPIKRVIQKEVLNNLSKEILSGQISAQSHILLDAFDEQLVFRNQTELQN